MNASGAAAAWKDTLMTLTRKRLTGAGGNTHCTASAEQPPQYQSRERGDALSVSDESAWNLDKPVSSPASRPAAPDMGRKHIQERAAKAGSGSRTGRERAKMRADMKPLPLLNVFDPHLTGDSR